MRYMQIDGGQKLHLVYEPGEGISRDKLIPAGRVSPPLCGRKLDNRQYQHGYRMTINAPLGHACLNCFRVYNARRRKRAQ